MEQNFDKKMEQNNMLASYSSQKQIKEYVIKQTIIHTKTAELLF